MRKRYREKIQENKEKQRYAKNNNGLFYSLQFLIIIFLFSYLMVILTTKPYERTFWIQKLKQLPDLSGSYLSVGIFIQKTWHACVLKFINVLQLKVNQCFNQCSKKRRFQLKSFLNQFPCIRHAFDTVCAITLSVNGAAGLKVT